MDEARFDHFARKLAGRANRRQLMKFAAGSVMAAGLTRTPALAQEPTQTPGPWVFDPTIAKPSEIATLMPLLSPSPVIWNEIHPERVMLSTFGVHFFDIQAGLTFNALNAQQAGALPPDTPLVGFWNMFQQPPKGGEPDEVGTTLDCLQLYFPIADEDFLPQYWQSYQDTYFPGLGQKNLGIDAIPNANYVIYDVTLADGRQCQVLAGVAQWGPFLIHVNLTAWDGSKPSASALKRVLIAQQGRYDDIVTISDESPLLDERRRHTQLNNPLYWDLGDLDWLIDAANQAIPEPVLVRPMVIDGIPTKYVLAPETNDGFQSVDNALDASNFIQPYPIDGTEYATTINVLPRIFESRGVARAEYDGLLEKFQDFPLIDSHTLAAGRAYFSAERSLPFGDGMTIPVFETVLLDGQIVTSVEILGGIPIAGDPTGGYGKVLRDVGAAARTYALAPRPGGLDPDPTTFPIEAALISALDFQGSCSLDMSKCSE